MDPFHEWQNDALSDEVNLAILAPASDLSRNDVPYAACFARLFEGGAVLLGTSFLRVRGRPSLARVSPVNGLWSAAPPPCKTTPVLQRPGSLPVHTVLTCVWGRGLGDMPQTSLACALALVRTPE